MKTKNLKVVAFIILLIGFATQANAQTAKRGAARQKMSVEKRDSLQCQRMANELMLNDATMAKFTPLYMNYLTELRNVWGSDKKADKKRDFGAMKERTDAEIYKSMEDRFTKSQKVLDIRTKYYKEFKRFLTAKQVEKIYQSKRMRRPGMGFCPMAGQGNRMPQMPFRGQKGKRFTDTAPLQKDSVKTNS